MKRRKLWKKLAITVVLWTSTRPFIVHAVRVRVPAEFEFLGKSGISWIDDKINGKCFRI
jgi:hypothetical protein